MNLRRDDDGKDRVFRDPIADADGKDRPVSTRPIEIRHYLDAARLPITANPAADRRR